MKKDIHPKYYADAKIKCACGSVLETGSTQNKIEVEICSNCHPFFTGDKKVVDTAGRVERFKQITAKSAQKKEATKKANTKTKIKDTEKIKKKKEKNQKNLKSLKK